MLKVENWRPLHPCSQHCGFGLTGDTTRTWDEPSWPAEEVGDDPRLMATPDVADWYIRFGSAIVGLLERSILANECGKHREDAGTVGLERYLPITRRQARRCRHGVVWRVVDLHVLVRWVCVWVQLGLALVCNGGRERRHVRLGRERRGRLSQEGDLRGRCGVDWETLNAGC